MWKISTEVGDEYWPGEKVHESDFVGVLEQRVAVTSCRGQDGPASYVNRWKFVLQD